MNAVATPLKHESWLAGDGVTHAGEVHEQANGFSVVNCEHCGFKHVLPLPTTEELKHVYAHEYYTQEKPLYIERYLEDKSWWEDVYNERYDKLEKFLGDKRRKILDVGSGPGLFLLKGQERGWTVKGIEPSQRAAAHSRESLGLDVIEAFLDAQLAPTLGLFDAINLGEVLEHLPDPAAMLKLVHGLLEKDGMLCVIVPNDFNPIQRALRDHLGQTPWWVAPPHHLNYFDAQSLAALLERCGFRLAHREVTFPIDLFLMMGKNYIGNDTLGRECHAMRKAFESGMRKSGESELMNKMYQGFLELGLGRELVFMAQKVSA